MAESGSEEQVNVVLRGWSEIGPLLKDIEKLQAQFNQLSDSSKKFKEVSRAAAEFKAVSTEANKMAQEVKKSGGVSSESIDKLIKKINSLRQQSQKAVGFGVPQLAGTKEHRQFVKEMNERAYLVKGGAQTFSMAIRNIVGYREALNDITVAGKATRSSVDAMTKGGVGFLRPIESAAERMRLTLGTVKTQLADASLALRRTAKESQWTGRQMMEGITLPVTLLGAAALRTFETTGREMVQLKKVTEFSADYDKLTKSIEDTTRAFGSTTRSVTALYKEVAALGVDGEENIAVFANAIQEIALVGDINMTSAMDFFRTMNALFAGGQTDIAGLEKTRELMAKMSAIADETALQLQDLADAFPEVAPVMKNLGFTAAGTAASIAAMYKAGIPATEAAHALKFSLQRLTSPTADAKEIIDQIGFSFFDAAGNIGLADLKIMSAAKAFAGMNAEQKQLALTEVFDKRQASRIQSYLDQVEIARIELGKLTRGEIDATQVTSDYARALMASGQVAGAATEPMSRYQKAIEEIKKDPTMGLKILRAELDIFMNKLGTAIAPAVIAVGEKLTKLLNIFSDMPPILQQSAIGIAVLAAALGPLRFILGQVSHVASVAVGAISMLLPSTQITAGAARALAQAGVDGVTQVYGQYQFAGSFMDKLRMKYLGVDAVIKKHSGTKTLDMIATQASDEATDDLKESQAQLAAAIEVVNAALLQQISALSAQAAAAEAARAARGTGIEDELVTGTAGGWRATPAGRKAGLAAGFLDETTALANMTDDQILKLNNRLDDTIDQFAGVASAASKSTDKVDDLGKQVAKSAGSAGILSGIMATLSSGPGLAALAAVAAAAAAVGTAFMWIKSNWDTIWPIIKPAVDQLRAAWEEFKDAIGMVVEEFGKLWSEVTSYTTATDGAASSTKSFVTQSAVVLKAAIEIIAKLVRGAAEGMKVVARLVQYLKPVFESLYFRMKGAVDFFVKLIQGDFKGALKGLLLFVYEMARPFAMFFQLIVKVVLKALSMIGQAFTSVYGFLAKIPKVGGLFKSMSESSGRASKQLEEWSKSLNFVGWIDKQLRGVPKVVGETFDTVGQEVDGKLADVGEMGADDIAKSLSGAVQEWFPDWLSSIKSALDNQISSLREGAQKAMEAAHKAALEVFDERTKKIEEQEDAEKRLYDTEKYYQERREMLRDRELARLNYQKERALAIYEGRFDDVRMLDLEERKDKEDFSSDLNKLDESRSKDLLEEARKAEKKRIQDEKDAAEERLRVQKEAFDQQLELITRYAPRNAEEYDKMLGKINNLLKQYGVETWPNTLTDGMKNFQEVFKRAADDIREDFYWSGKDAAAQWMAGFAPIDVAAKILAKLSSGKSEGEAGFNMDIGGGGFMPAVPEETPASEPVQVPEFTSDQQAKINALDEQFRSRIAMQKIALSEAAKTGVISQKEHSKAVEKLNKQYEEFRSKVIPEYGRALKNNNKMAVDVMEKTVSASSKMVDNYGNTWTAVKGKIVNQYGETGRFIIDKTGQITGIMNTSTGQTAKVWDSSMTGMKNGIASAGGTINASWDGTNVKMRNAMYVTGQDVQNTARGTSDGVTRSFGSIGSRNPFDNIVQRFRESGFTIGTIWNAVTTLFNNPLEVAGGLWKNVVHLFARAAQSIINLIRGLPWIGELLAGENSAIRRIVNYTLAVTAADGGYFKAKPGGVLVNLAEAGYDEYVISTDPRYRARSVAFMAAASAKLGMAAKSGAAINASISGASMPSAATMNYSDTNESNQNVYISVDTFIGEEQWFASMAEKYNMKAVPKQRKIEGQQKRKITSYNDRYRLR